MQAATKQPLHQSRPYSKRYLSFFFNSNSLVRCVRYTWGLPYMVGSSSSFFFVLRNVYLLYTCCPINNAFHHTAPPKILIVRSGPHQNNEYSSAYASQDNDTVQQCIVASDTPTIVCALWRRKSVHGWIVQLASFFLHCGHRVYLYVLNVAKSPSNK